MNQKAISKKALIVGASRGLGLGLVKEYLNRGWNVIATERDGHPSKGLLALSSENPKSLRIEKLEINNTIEISKLKNNLQVEELDLLFVNAGIMDDRMQSAGEASTEEFNTMMLTNALSPLRVIESLDHLVKPKGTIAVMSSGLASISGNTSGSTELYRTSKAALNMFFKSYGARAGKDRCLLAMIPGWVKTDMGGAGAQLEIETSVRGIADTIEKRKDQSGVYFVDYKNEIMPW